MHRAVCATGARSCSFSICDESRKLYCYVGITLWFRPTSIYIHRGGHFANWILSPSVNDMSILILFKSASVFETLDRINLFSVNVRPWDYWYKWYLISETDSATRNTGRKMNQFSFVCVSFNTWQKQVIFFIYMKERIPYNSVCLILLCVKNFA